MTLSVDFGVLVVSPSLVFFEAGLCLLLEVDAARFSVVTTAAADETS